MKKLALAAALSLYAVGATAGTMAPPAMEPAVVKEDTSSSQPGGMVLLLLLALGVYAATR
ncbi:MAG: hypothetical protein D6832_04845 [Alphaproteobacteria bacterium]|nr:MAG: hypothetical protein D6832_04845 [Alphaproteobacteria bacterium]